MANCKDATEYSANTHDGSHTVWWGGITFIFSAQRMSTQIVKLNIGGHKYLTTKATLCDGVSKDNFFTALLSGKHGCLQDEKGYYFIDRNGKYFEHILEYLRTGEWRYHKDLEEEKLLLQEAKFFNIEVVNYTHVSDGSLHRCLQKAKNKALSEVYEANKEALEPLTAHILQEFYNRASTGTTPVHSTWIFPTVRELVSLVGKPRNQQLVQITEGNQDCAFLANATTLMRCKDVVIFVLQQDYSVTAQVSEERRFICCDPGWTLTSVQPAGKHVEGICFLWTPSLNLTK